MSDYSNASAYKFVSLGELSSLRESLRIRCRQLSLKGTILLSHEGINLFIAGEPAAIDEFLTLLRSHSEFADLQVKLSTSDYQPFNRMLVKIKREIISFGVPEIDPAKCPAPKIRAVQLKQWLDEKRPFTLLDVRNNYEVAVGTFADAVRANIDHFRQFPAAFAELSLERNQPVVMFCTGGIRCEKAAPFMLQHGYGEVYHLDGGILKYFEEVGGAHFDGECFVFDKRVALDPSLDESETTQCYACQAILSRDDVQLPQYRHGQSCPHCYIDPDQQMQHLIEQRHQEIASATSPLPGSTAYENVRPLNVPAKFDGLRLIEFLAALHPQIERQQWLQTIAAGRIQAQHRALDADELVHASQRLVHLIPQTVEPPVNVDIRILFEDSWLIVVDKPAPLPVHPSGRFNRNTLVHILDLAYQPLFPRPQHRLDANTTGIVVFAKTRRVAAQLQQQFESREVSKTYLAKVFGHPATDEFTIDKPISVRPNKNGKRICDEAGLESQTQIRVLERNPEGTALLQVHPITGRTNQIRIHLWEVGLPIVGDPIYGTENNGDVCQTLLPGDPPMCLHHWRIGIRHPVTGCLVSFASPSPKWVERLPPDTPITVPSGSFRELGRISR